MDDYYSPEKSLADLQLLLCLTLVEEALVQSQKGEYAKTQAHLRDILDTFTPDYHAKRPVMDAQNNILAFPRKNE